MEANENENELPTLLNSVPGDNTPSPDGQDRQRQAGRSSRPHGDSYAEDDALIKETLIPVHGLVRLSDREMQVMSHAAFQRLFEIFQLGQTHLVYRGATHMRGQHAVGAVHVVTLMADAIQRGVEGARVKGDQAIENERLDEHWRLGPPLTNTERAFTRLGALLHDIGHLAVGHTLEDELGVLDAHDEVARLKLVLEKTTWHGIDTGSLASLIDRLYAADAANAGIVGRNDAPLTPSDIIVAQIAKDAPQARASGSRPLRLRVCQDLVGNTICADLLDYLHRDWLYLGKPKHFDGRLLDYLEIRARRNPTTREDEHRLVISLKGGTRPRPDAVTAIIDLLESRYQLAEIALFHRVKVTATAMLERVIAEYRDSFEGDQEQDEIMKRLESELLECCDFEALGLLNQWIVERRDAVTSKVTRSRLDGALTLARRLRIRSLHRELHILYEDDLAGVGPTVRERFSGQPGVERHQRRADHQRTAQNRLLALRLLEADFELKPGSIVMYCPGQGMNSKIAEVSVFVDEAVHVLAELDKHDPRVTGGHLNAQQTRHRRLWRVVFAIDRETFAELEGDGRLGLLLHTIDHAVLRKPPRLRSHELELREIAARKRRIAGENIVADDLVLRTAGRTDLTLTYPGGAPSLQNFQPK